MRFTTHQISGDFNKLNKLTNTRIRERDRILVNWCIRGFKVYKSIGGPKIFVSTGLGLVLLGLGTRA